MRQLQHDFLLTQLQRLPSRPWLWLAPTAAWTPQPPPSGRGLCLLQGPVANAYGGDVQCRLPLPMPAEAVNAIVLQHPGSEGLAALLGECSRVLMPGGRLWLTLLNPYSPYRVHWQRHAAAPAGVTQCRSLLRREGLQCAPPRHLGPLWSERGTGGRYSWSALRAVCVLEAEKREAAVAGPGKVPVSWRGPLPT